MLLPVATFYVLLLLLLLLLLLFMTRNERFISCQLTYFIRFISCQLTYFIRFISCQLTYFILFYFLSVNSILDEQLFPQMILFLMVLKALHVLYVLIFQQLLL